MRKPKAFKAVLSLILIGSGSAILAAILSLSRYPAPIIALFEVLTLLAATTVILVVAIRTERQNQRTNSNLASIIRALGRQPRDVALKHDVEKLTSSVSRLDTCLNVEASKLAATVSDLRREVGDQADQMARATSKVIEQTERVVNQTVSASSAVEKIPACSDSTKATPNSASVAAVGGHTNRLAQTPRIEYSERLEKNSEFYTPFVSNPDAARPAYELIELSEQPLKVEILVEGAEVVDLKLTLVSEDTNPNYKSGLVSAQAFDNEDRVIDYPVLPAKSDKYGYFNYLATSTEVSDFEMTLQIPARAVRINLSFFAWSSKPKIVNRVTGNVKGKLPGWFRKRGLEQVRVAAILDEFSYNSFKFECDLINLSFDSWRKEMDDHQPEVFLCESAWSGGDSDTRPWKGRVYASENFAYENRTELLRILDYCREREIPTVFWNKEDPSHYDDKAHNFVDTALKFDHIFTTDLASADRYRQEHGHQSVGVIPFAVQPKLFNPIERQPRSKDAVFAGGWYANHSKRSRAMENTFDSLIDAGYRLKIYDRFYGSNDPSKQFPPRFQEYLNPPVPNEDMAAVYKESVFGITFNTETNSPTMFARRIFELMACNTFVLSNFSNGVYNFFGDNVHYMDRGDCAIEDWSEDAIAKARDRNLQTVLSEHTYKQRLTEMLKVAGIEFDPHPAPPAITCRVHSAGEAKDALRFLRTVGMGASPKVILVASDVSNLEYADILMDLNGSGISIVSETLLLRGSTPVSEVTGSSSHTLLFQSGWLPSAEEVERVVSRFLLHAQYTNLPIADAMTPDAKYRILESAPRYAVLVSADEIVHYITDWATGTPTLTYCV